MAVAQVVEEVAKGEKDRRKVGQQMEPVPALLKHVKNIRCARVKYGELLVQT